MKTLNSRTLHSYVPAVCLGLALTSGIATGEDPVAWWTFDTVREGKVADRATDRNDRVEGNYKVIRGAESDALLFDGFTTVIDRPAAEAPRLDGDFSIEAWVAQGAHPWNWCPLITQQRDQKAGYAFSVGPRGQIRLELAVDGAWQSCESEDWVLPLRQWIHVAGTYDARQGITLYVNGRTAGTHPLEGQITWAPDVDLRIGTNHALTKPSHIHREHGTVASFWCLDGAIDDLRIYNKALSPSAVAKAYEDAMPLAECDIQPRRMPSGPKGPGRFGAVYCKLAYYEQWDALWRVDDHPDVLVRFDQTPVRVVFWRGSRYSPAWVTDNDQWMADQSVEAWKTGDADTDGCFEHMQDRLCRYSHVRIIESNDARTVVHWRYAPVSSKNHLWNVDEKTGRACWIDEYYTIYPDAIGVRKPTWKTGTLGGPHQFQESLPFTNPDQFNNDVVEKDFCTVANMQGEQLTLRFVENPAKTTENVPSELTIQRYNFRSPYDPVIIYEPGNHMHYVKDRDIRGYTRPGACNHWPVGQARCDGRTVQTADRPTHFLGFPISYPPVHENEDRSWWNGLYGMTNLPMDTLVRVARSWNHPPALSVSEGVHDLGYDRGQRAFVLDGSNPPCDALKIRVAADKESPIYNPAFVILGWSASDATLTINGEEVPRGPDFRIGHRHRLESTDLVVWLKLESTEPIEIALHPFALDTRAPAEEAATPLTEADSEILFVRRTAPLLREKCLGCHGDNPDEIEGGLDLRSLESLTAGGDSEEPGIVAGNPEGSSIYLAAERGEESCSAMPPKEAEKLSKEQLRWLHDWIESGAKWPSKQRQEAVHKKYRDAWSAEDGIAVKTSGGLSADWTNRKYDPAGLWAYQPVAEVMVKGKRNPIDVLIEQAVPDGLSVAPRADRRTLIRRVTFDLTGLPPTPSEVEDFLNDPKPDRDVFACVVDRLLESPHYGERMAQHWLDVVRYADSSGFANDYERGNAWRYRESCCQGERPMRASPDPLAKSNQLFSLPGKYLPPLATKRMKSPG